MPCSYIIPNLQVHLILGTVLVAEAALFTQLPA